MRILDSVAWTHAPATAYERFYEKSEYVSKYACEYDEYSPYIRHIQSYNSKIVLCIDLQSFFGRETIVLISRWSLGILLFEMLTGRSPFQVVVHTMKVTCRDHVVLGEERGRYVQEDPERAGVLPEDPCGVFLQFFIHRGSICV